jgi:O-antigen/teichoic acid export membrane protein
MSLRKEGTSAIAWSLIEKFLKRGVQFILSIFLARLLTPSDFGVVAMATIFVSWAEVFSDFGMGQAIIQRKDVTETQKSTVFYINLMMGVLIAIVFMLIAPWAARFYDNEMVAWVVRVSGLTFIIHALNVVQSSLFKKALNFKVGTIASLLSSSFSGIAGIIMAYFGFGVWSLLTQSVLSAAITTLFYWLKSEWRPKRVFNFNETKPLFTKGIGFMGQGLVSNVFSSLDSMAIGKLFSTASLGLFARGKTLAFMPGNTILSPISRPLFPLFAKIHNEEDRLKDLYMKTNRMLTWAATFISGFMLLMSYEIIYILYGEQWVDASEFLFLFSLIVPLNANNVTITSVWKATGNVKILVKITFIERLFAFCSLAGLFWGIRWYAIAYIVADILTNLIKSICHWKAYKISVFEQYKEMILEGGLIVIAYILFLFIPFSGVYLNAIIKFFAFTIIYIGGCRIFKAKGMQYANEYLKPVINKVRRK